MCFPNSQTLGKMLAGIFLLVITIFLFGMGIFGSVAVTAGTLASAGILAPILGCCVATALLFIAAFLFCCMLTAMFDTQPVKDSDRPNKNGSKRPEISWTNIHK